MKYLLLLFLISTASASEGGHTGNGGGIVRCQNKEPVVLDYFEAKEKGYKLLNLKNMSRKEFFDKIFSRIKFGSNNKLNFIGTNKIGGNVTFYYDIELKKILSNKKEIMSWEEINEWKVHDEFIEDSLPSNCSFQQAAITTETPGKKIHSYRIKGTVESLSDEQKRILELHELLQEFNKTASSQVIRNLVQVLIKDSIRYKEIRIAILQFDNPYKNYRFSSFSKLEVNESLTENFNGLYALDLRDSSLDEEIKSCPKWLAISTLSESNLILQQYNDDKNPSFDLYLPNKNTTIGNKKFEVKINKTQYNRTTIKSNIKESITLNLTSENLIYEQNNVSCNYIKIENSSEFTKSIPLYSKNKPLFPKGWPSTFYIKSLRTYYELKRLNLISPHENEINTIRKTLNW